MTTPPMVLVPALVVPVFVMMNMFVAARLIERWFEARNAGSGNKLERESHGFVPELDAQ